MQTNNPGSLKEKFGNFGAAPTEQLWNSISSSLDQKEKKHRGIFWWWFAGIAASGLLLFGIYYAGYQVGKNEANLAEKNTDLISQDSESNLTNSNLTVDQNAIPQENNIAKDDQDKVSDVHTAGLQSNTRINSYEESDLENKPNASINRSLPFVDMTVSDDDNLVITATEKITHLDHPKIHKITLPHQDNFNPSFNSQQENLPQDSKWELGFSVGSQISPEVNQQALYEDLGNGITADSTTFDNTVEGSGLYSSLSPMNGTVSRPISIDFSVARTFGPRWSVQSGLGINWIKSTTNYDNFEFSSVDASFLSISVPIIAEFDFVKRKRLEFSTGFGIVNEVPIFSKSTSVYPLLQSTTVSKSITRGFMFSGLANLGVSYRLTEKMKIGLHPNIRHYFFQSMKSEYPVLEKKTWIGANIGLVWEI